MKMVELRVVLLETMLARVERNRGCEDSLARRTLNERRKEQGIGRRDRCLARARLQP